jgi:hypothetical protein
MKNVGAVPQETLEITWQYPLRAVLLVIVLLIIS